MSNLQSFQEILLVDEKTIPNVQSQSSNNKWEDIGGKSDYLLNKINQEEVAPVKIQINVIKSQLIEEDLQKQNLGNIQLQAEEILLKEEKVQQNSILEKLGQTTSVLNSSDNSVKEFEIEIGRKIYTNFREKWQKPAEVKAEPTDKMRQKALVASEAKQTKPDFSQKKPVKRNEQLIACQRMRQKVQAPVKDPKKTKTVEKLPQKLFQEQKPEDQEFIAQTRTKFKYFFDQCMCQAPQFTCPEGYQAKFVCASKQCQQNSNICSEARCQCQQKHKNCILKLMVQMFVDQLNQNLERQREIAFELFLFQEKIINNIEKNRNKMKKLLLFQGMGTQKYAQVQKDDKQPHISLKGSNILATIDQFYQQKKYDANRLEFVQKQLKEEKKNVSKILQSTATLVLKKYNKEQLIQIPSHLILNKPQIKYVLEQLNFPKEIKLLYRASEHEFSLPKYHKLCSNVENTLTIIKTEHQKLIGGFTPIKLSSKIGRDRSNKTFLMAISLKEKLEHIHSGESAIHYDKELGPCFGGLYEQRDIQVFQQNGVLSCITNFPSTYNWKRHFLPSQESWRFLTGVSEGKKCRVMDFEVFKIQFRE